MRDKIDQLFGDLQSRGFAKDKTNQEFRDYMLAPGEQGYQNRKQFFEDFKSQGMTDLETYEDFAALMGLHAGTPERRNIPQPQQPANDEFQQTINNANQTIAQSRQAERRIGNRQQRIGLDLPQGDFGRVNLGQNRKVTKGQQRLNPETGELEDTYVTPQGNEYENREMADVEQNVVDQQEWNRNNPKEALEYSIDGQIAKLEEEIRKQESIEGIPTGFGTTLYQSGLGVPYTPNSQQRSYDDMRMALRDLQEAKTMLERNKQLHASSDFLGGVGIPFTKDWYNNWKNFGYGVWDALHDVSLYDFGVSELGKAGAYMRIKNKIDNGEELTDQETDIALAGMALSQAQQLADLPHGYTAGVTTTEMAPFMAQMAANPASGMGKAFARKAVRKFGRDGIGAITARVAARVAGNIGEAAVLSNTWQAGKTAADIMRRNNGEQFAYDEDGNVIIGHYEKDEDGNDVFVEGGKDLGQSIFEGEAASIIENFTELGAGGSINGMLSKAAGSKLGKKIGLGYISDLVGKVGTTPFARSMKKFMERTHWDGMIEEPLEEEYGIILNSLLTGDNKISDLWDSKQQADIFAGTMWFGGMMAAMNTAAYPFAKRAMRRNLNNADVQGEMAFGDEWPTMKATIDNMDDKDIAGFLYGIKDDGNFNNEQKAAMFGYAARLKQYQGANTADMLMRMEGNLTDEESAIKSAYDNGSDIETPDEMKSAVDEAEAAGQNLTQYGPEFTAMVANGSVDPTATLNYMMNNRDTYSDEEIAAAADYYQKHARAQGVMDSAMDRIDLEVEKANAEVRGNMHQQSGQVITAQSGDGAYYIIGGDVATDEETGMPIIAGTGGAVVVKDALTGEVSVKSPQDVRITSMQNADDMFRYNEEVLRQQLEQQADEDITYGSPANEVYDFEDQVTLQDGNGGTIDGTVVMLPNAVDGVFVVETSDGKALQMTADELNRRIVAHNGQEVQRAAVIQQQTEQAEGQINGQGNGQNAQENAVNPSDNQQGTKGDKNIQSGIATGEKSLADDRQSEESSQPQSALERIPIRRDSQGNPVKGKNGRPVLDWHKASVEDAAAALIETTGGDMVLARDTASDLVKNEQARLEKIRKQKPKGDDPIEIAESRVAIRKQEQEQQAIIKQWQDVNQAIQKQMRDEQNRLAAEREAAKSAEQKAREAEEARIRKEQQDEQDRQRLREQIEKDKAKRNREYEPLVKAREELADDPDALDILNDTEPRDLEEWVSSLLRPHSMLWQDASDAEIGLQSELGLKRADMQRMMSLLGTKESGAKPFGKVVLDIYEGLSDAMKEQYTDEDVRRVLLNLFNEGSSARMLNLTQEHRIEEAREMAKENARRDAEAEMDAWADAYHLTPEERETYNDWLQLPPTEPEQEIINNIIADESYRRSLEEDQQSVSRTDVSGSETGESQVQQTVEATGNGNNEAGPAQGGEVQTGEPPVSDHSVSGSGSVIPQPEVDKPRLKAIRRNLADAYSAALDTGGRDPGDLQAIGEAAREVRKYVDEGLDDYRPYEDGIEDYDGDDPEKLADQYITRVYHDRYADDDADEQYIRTGLKPDMRVDNEFVEYNGKKFEANDVGICINPNVIKKHDNKKSVSEGYEIMTALSDKGWTGAVSVSGPTYGFGSGVSAGWYDKYFETEDECQAYWAQKALDYLKGQNDKKMVKYMAALQLIIDKNKPKEQLSPRQEANVSQGGNQKPATIPIKSWTTKNGRKIELFLMPESVDDDGNRHVKIGRSVDGGEISTGTLNGIDISQDLIDYDTTYADAEDAISNDQNNGTKYVATEIIYLPDGRILARGTIAGDKTSFWLKSDPLNSVSTQSSTAEPIGKTSTPEEIAAEEAKVDTNPTEGQKEAGNYQKGHINVDGYDITIENPKGSVRSGVDSKGNRWETTMHNTYGYIRGTEGVDGDHIDVFLSDNPTSGSVFVVDQVNPDTGAFDEHKVMYGFASKEEAREAYLANYDEGWQGLGAITEVSREEFKKWVESSHRKTKPFHNYKRVNTAGTEILAKGGSVLYPNNGGVIKVVGSNIDKNTGERYYTCIVYENEEGLKGGNDVVGVKFRIDQKDMRNNLDNGTYMKQRPQKQEPSKPEKQHKRLVSDDKMEELRKRLLEKMNNLNEGLDMERMLIGAAYAVGKIERGVTKFADFCADMIEDLGDAIRPYLKLFYNGARDLPEAAELRPLMDDAQTVEAFDVYNFDKKKQPTAIEKAEQVVQERKVRQQAKKIKAEQPDLFAGDLFGTQQEPLNQKQTPGSAWWSDPNRPQSIDPKNYKTYMTDEAKEYFANFVSEDGKTDFTKWAHPNLAYITAAIWDEVEIPYEDLKDIPEIVEAENIIKKAEAKGKLEISDEEANRLAQRLVDMSQARQERKALVIIGLPAGGKSSVFANPLAKEYGARIIDSDDVKPWLDGFDGGNGAGYVHDASAEVAERAIDISVKNGDNIIIPRIGGQSVMDLSAALRLAGYDVQLYFNDVKGVTSIDRAASRFAQTGRYLSLDYLTKKAGVPSDNFSKFAEKSIGGFLDERDQKEVQDIRGRLQRLRGELYGSGSGLWESLAAKREGAGETESTVPADLGGGEQQAGGDGVSLLLAEPLFNYAEWKSNDVRRGEKPKEIWNSKSGKPMPGKEKKSNDNNDELHSVRSGQRVSAESSQVGEGAEQAGGPANQAGAERSPESDRAERSGRERSVEKTLLAVPDEGEETRDSSGGPGGRSDNNARVGIRTFPKHNNRRNNVGERGKDYAPTSPKARFNANVEAIKLMRVLMDEGIEAPTKDQMEVLRQYSGWGGLGTFFNDDKLAENRILRDLLTEEEYNNAVMSINSAYYTPATVIDTLWDIAEAMGFEGGNVLEGSAGIGNIIGQMPKKLSSRSDIEAVEIDKISGNILKLLYPDAKVHIAGFQDVKIPNGSVDLAVTNVPFVTGLHVFDEVDKDLSRKFKNIHDFCIAKNIRKLREGGIGLFITSSGTLDKSTDLRAWITDEGQADVVGAFRLNNDTFGGTNVTSDIIVVRKRVNGVKSDSAIDVKQASPLRVGSYPDKYDESKEHQTTMTVNDYFHDHPEMMAGEMFFGYEKGDTFRPGSYGLYPVEGKNQEKMMKEFVKAMGKAKEVVVTQQQTQQTEPNQLTAVKEGRMLVDDNGRLCVSRYGTAVPLGLNNQKVKGYTKQQCFEDYQAVQKAVDEVLQQQLNDPDDTHLEPKLKALNAAYDKFVKRYGTLHKNTAISFLRNDIDFPSFQALENYSETKDMSGKVKVTTKKTPLFSQRVLGFKTEPQPKTVKDAVIASIFRSNGIDLDWIATKLSEVAAPPNGDHWTADDVRRGILVSRLGFEDPTTGQIEIRYKYLSGNVREKLAMAEAYNTDGKYAANIEELRKVIPMDIPAHLIDFSLGSSWIPVELYKQYLEENFDLSNIKLSHVEGNWVLDEGYGYRNEKNRVAGVYSEQFRETIYGHQLVAAALNNRPYKVSKQVSEGWGSSKTTKTVVDKNATQACAVRVDEIKDEFKQWAKKKMQDDPELGARIEKIYNEKFNALVPMEIDDEFLPEHFEGSNTIITLRPHQKRGVIRDLSAPTMLAHEVGTGKSFTLITTAMEMRRLGTARKPMIVVQNATVAQMTSDVKLLYPNAKVLSLTEKDRDAEGRRAFYAKIKFNDWDVIIIPQSTFERIPDSPERELQFIQEKIDEKKHVIEAAMQSGMDSREIQRLQRELDKLQDEYGDKYLDSDPANASTPKKGKKKDAKKEAAALDKAKTKAQEQLDRATDDVQFFDDLGVDALLIDEAHEYKHLGFQTSIGRGIKGIDPSYSKKCAGLYNKTRSVFEKAGWKNVVFATGTPISNTAAEIWTFMKYLMPADMMRANDIYYFDDFVHNFGAISQMLEFATSGKFKENTRFAAYVNKPELIRIWSMVADTVLTKDAEGVKDKLPKKEGGKDQDVFLPQSPSLIRIMAAVRAELERFENMTGQEKKENSSIPLTMYGIAKRAAIDPRLVDPNAPDEPMSKTNAAVKEIVKDLKETAKYKGTVAVFCDNQNRKGPDGSIEFNIYEDMKKKLVEAGVPADQIAIIKSGMSITAKQKVFDAVNDGSIRVVLGSTQTLGTGVNMQERLHLLIHMDAPDRPMDYTQRNGRIERQGNLHKDWDKPIRIVRFGVEDSLDVTAYQRLKTKSGFINSIMDGKEALANNQVDRTVEEEEEGLFDNPVAVLSGSQYALKKNQAERELRKYQGKKAQWEADQVYVANQLRRNKSEVEATEANIKTEEEQLAHIRNLFPDGKVKTITVDGVPIDMTKDDGEKKLNETIKEKINDPVNAIVKRNRENAIYNDETLHYTIKLDGHDVNFTVQVMRESVYDQGRMRTVIHKYISYASPDLRIESTAGSTSVRENLEEILDEVVTGRDYEDRIEAYKARIDRINAETEQLQQRVGMEFQFDKELEQARKNVDEYTELMKKEMKEKEAKYAAQQKEAKEKGGFDLSKAEDNEEDEDVRYSADEDWDEPVFYSNAMRAVEDIRQEKATPEQWLAMIQKNGGLKAGEDKWLGLSDWLNSTDKRTVTKDEILDYIRQNQIEVEETPYYEGEEMDSILDGIYETEGLEFRDDFAEAFDIIMDEFAITDEKAAVDLYNREHEDSPVEYDGYALDEDSENVIMNWASDIVDKAKNRRKRIDDTRLSYTTQGLDNKQEIALTVPTIEPYNESDNIHFGDAGGGRAVAWIRFGDAYYNKNGEPTEVDKQWSDFMGKMAEKYGKDRDDTLGLLTSMTDEEREEMNRLDKQITEKEKRNMGRVLVIDEIQSKRHQNARDKGYKSDAIAKIQPKVDEVRRHHQELVSKRDELIDRETKLRDAIRMSPEAKALIGEDGYVKKGKTAEYHALFENNKELNDVYNERKDVIRELLELEQEMREMNGWSAGLVPDAPFERNWHELAMKRMLRYAAENGYDKIAWTTGNQQAERYDLGQSIRKIQSFEPDDYAKEHGEYRNIQIDLNSDDEPVFVNVDKEGNIMSSDMDELRGRKLSEVLGKDLANKILSEEPGREYSGEDLRIGGEGMKGFYDDILPRFMNKYGKKWGVKVGQIDLPDLEKSAQKMWSIDVTPEMKKSVMQGQPMFRGADEFVEGQQFPIRRVKADSSYNVLGRSYQYSSDLLPDEFATPMALLDAVRNAYPDYYATIEAESIVMRSWDTVMAEARNARTVKNVKGTESYVERKTRQAIDAVTDMANRMHLDVEVLTTTEGLTGKKARSKGWFNPRTHKIVIVLPNHTNKDDVINTLLHEGVAHYGLRKMFGQNFDTFLDNVYNNVSPEIKARIDAAMKRNGWSRHEATEEYLARLAEHTDFERATQSGWWQKIKEFFYEMLSRAGFDTMLTDNELRYILWRSYDHLIHPDGRRNVFDTAKDIQMQSHLKVGDYAGQTPVRRTAVAEAAPVAAEQVNEELLNSNIQDIPSQELLLTLHEKGKDERNEAVNELVRRIREGEARIIRMGQEVQLDRGNDAQIAGAILGGWQLGLSAQSDGTLRGVVQGGSQMVSGSDTKGQDTSPDSELPIISWAKATGHYYDEEKVKKQSLDKNYWHSGAESRVYRTADGKKVIKFMETWVYYQNPLLKRIDDITFQNAAGFEHLNVLGYSLDEKGNLLTVAEQDLVDGVTVDDMFDDDGIDRINNYIDRYLQRVVGLSPHWDENGHIYYMKDGIQYRDIHGANVIVDKKGKPHIIDALVERAIDSGKERAEGFSIDDEEKELYSIRTKEPPKKTGKGYKVFVLKDGQLYPPMVANPNGEGTPIGVWLDADAAPVAGTSKTGRPQVKAGGKGTQGGSGQLAYRPGWHLGTIPYALQFGRKDKNGERTLFPNNFVWAEVEYADDVDYQDEARQEGMNANGKYQHSLAGLKHVPTDGSYKYRTNPDPKTDEWIITGAMRVNKILSREEVDELVKKAGREPQKVQDGDILTQDIVDELNAEIKATKEADEMGLLYRDDDAWTDDVAQQMYEKAVAQEGIKVKEAWQDSMVALKLIQNAIAAETGRVATGAEDAYRFENRMHGRAKNMTEQYDWKYYRPMLKAFNDFCKANGLTQEQGMEYLISKSGLERNVYYAFRDGAKAKLADDIKREREQLEKAYARGRISEADYRTKLADLNIKEQNGVDDFMKDVRETYAYQHAKEEYDAGNIGYTEYLRIIETIIRDNLRRKTPKKDDQGHIVSDNYYDDYAKDYSGLTETFAKEMYDSAQKIRKEAQMAIDPQVKRGLWAEYDEAMRQAYQLARQMAEDAVFAGEEGAAEPQQHTELWKKINDATKETLRQSYESGLMDRNTYNKVRAMFDYYIPLRGWDEDKASDVYTYMGRDNIFSPAVKKAWGRTSKAENPLAYIGNIAVSTILSGHRNQMKQHFLNYVMNNPTSLVSISESWYENIAPEGEAPVWILRTADTAGKSPDEIATIVNDFNDEMHQKQREGKAMPVKGRLRLDVHATSGQKAEHVVEVQRAGHTYQLYINGNPKAAQALNGSAARAVSRISDTWLGKKITKINRDMAMFFTSKNPAFVVSNLSRDLNMAGASVAVNESKAYNKRFIANMVKVLAPRLGESSKWVPASKQPTGLMPSLMRKWQNGTLDLSNETERYFGEFMDEGGETGFVNMLSIDSFKEKMKKEIAEMNGSAFFGKGVKETTVHKGLRLLGETFEFYNRCAEDATRFIVYMTSRQMGKTLEESIADAKDVTLNFNRKGTGGLGNAEVRDLFIFVNPAIQALANMYRMAKGHPLKFGAVTAAFVAGGALMPIINQWLLNMFGDDDDKQAYWNLPPWVRKNNFVMWIPFTKNFLTIPLAQEFRVFYGVGEMMSSAIMDHPMDKWGLEVFSSVADLVPINPTGNGGNLMVDFAPTMVQPLMQVGENVDFTGKPIWRENQGNKHAPMYEKAYVTTPQWMIKMSEKVNDLTGGNEGKKGVVEKYAPFWGDYINNPAVWNHLLQGYFGGMYNTIAKTFDVGVTAAKGELPKIYQTPVINRFLNRPVERDNAGALGEEYYNLTEERDALQYELRTWQKKAADGEEGAQEHVDEILESPEYKRAEVVSHYETIMKDLKAGERSATESADKADIKESIGMYKQQMMEELNAINDGKEPLDAAVEAFNNARTFAEKNRLRMRIERLMMRQNGAAKPKTKGRAAEVEKALSYVKDIEDESRDTNEQYLSLASADDVRDDARIKAAKAKVKAVNDEYKLLMADSPERAAQFYRQHEKELQAYRTIDEQSRVMNRNKKLLGKGSDQNIMHLIANSRRLMLNAIDKMK